MFTSFTNVFRSVSDKQASPQTLQIIQSISSIIVFTCKNITIENKEELIKDNLKLAEIFNTH